MGGDPNHPPHFPHSSLCFPRSRSDRASTPLAARPTPRLGGPPSPEPPTGPPRPHPPPRSRNGSGHDLDAAPNRDARRSTPDRSLAGPPPLRRRRPRPPPQRLHRASPTLFSSTPVRALPSPSLPLLRAGCAAFCTVLRPPRPSQPFATARAAPAPRLAALAAPQARPDPRPPAALTRTDPPARATAARAVQPSPWLPVPNPVATTPAASAAPAACCARPRAIPPAL